MKLHIANKNYSSWSLRPWVLMRALGLDFEESLHPFPMGGGPTGFDAFSPTGKVPCLVDGGLTVWDSLAIAEYLAERHAAVWPPSAPARAWARSAAAEMHSGFSTLRQVCSMSCGVRVHLRDEAQASLAADLRRLQSLWREGLQRFGGPYLAGAAFTAVDAFFCPVAFRVQTYSLPLDPVCSAYVLTLLELPAMRQWYDSALSEPWVEPAHDADVLAFGELISDARVRAE
ncbi:MAG: glutathione S-transferase family protein [Betaproteobacteria bacterium]